MITMFYNELSLEEKLQLAPMLLSPAWNKMIAKGMDVVQQKLAQIDPNKPAEVVALEYKVVRNELEMYRELQRLGPLAGEELKNVTSVTIEDAVRG